MSCEPCIRFPACSGFPIISRKSCGAAVPRDVPLLGTSCEMHTVALTSCPRGRTVPQFATGDALAAWPKPAPWLLRLHVHPPSCAPAASAPKHLRPLQAAPFYISSFPVPPPPGTTSPPILVPPPVSDPI